MDRVLFLRLLLLLPLVPGAVGFPLLRAGIEPPGFSAIPVGASMVGLVPYLILSSALLAYLRGKPSEQYVRAFCWSPIWFLIPLNLCIAFFSVVYPPAMSLDDIPLPAVLLSIYGLVLGYFYVFVGYLGYRLANWWGLFARAA